MSGDEWVIWIIIFIISFVNIQQKYMINDLQEKVEVIEMKLKDVRDVG